MKDRRKYVLIFLILLMTEAAIALWVRDDFIRPYLGDVLVTVLLYFFLRIFIRKPGWWLVTGVFVLAAAVEVSQYFNLVELLHLEGSRFFRIVLGSTFDFKDIACYFVGCLLAGIWQYVEFRSLRKCNSSDRSSS